MTWEEITLSPEGYAQIETQMQKTGKDITIPLSDNALKWLPERSGQPASSRIFYKLPDQVTNADVRLRTTQIYAKIVDESKRKAVNLILKL